jgi:nucleotide-binding universal stress UspA family protein
MYRRILVPLDGSKTAEVVLPYAKELAGRLDLDPYFLHVCEPGSTETATADRIYINDLAQKVKYDIKEIQTETGEGKINRTLETVEEVIEGHAAEEIINYAQKKDIDLILLSTHGHSGIKQWAMGNNADKVLRKAKCPTLLVKAAIPEEIIHSEWCRRTILVPLDGSSTAEYALPHAEMLAKQRGIEPVKIVLVRVCEPVFVTADYPEASMKLTWEEHVKHMQDHVKEIAMQYLNKIQKRMEYSGIKVTSVVLMGKAADEIIKYAQDNAPNLIVMSTHGYSAVNRWEYGNIANKIVYGSRSPVFLVRPEFLNEI